MKFEIFTDTAAQYRWRLKGSNGEIVATSEGYEARSGAEATIKVVKAGVATAPIVDLTTAPPA